MAKNYVGAMRRPIFFPAAVRAILIQAPISEGVDLLATSGQLPGFANPLKTTTVEIYHGWQEE